MFLAPVKDLAFALEVVGLPALAADHFPDADADTVTAVLEGAAQIADDVLAPINRQGDKVGASLVDGRVQAAPGFAAAYKAYAQGGWTSLSSPPEHGGQGLPKAVGLAAFEMAHAANMAFALCPMLTEAAVEALVEHGTQAQQALYLPKLVSGEWTGCMNLTEPQAGSDLALVRTTATPDGEGGYRLNGTKIFITWGDHDAADNIVHLVLARTPDAPAGVKGISLFLASTHAVNADGSLGERNAVVTGGIEHKLGINASPTCTLLFEGAKAELIGRLNEGVAHMFTMMNAARLQVGVEGVGIAERAYQQALGYARDRRQGKSPWSADSTAVIADQPDVRRMLMLMKAKIEAARMICLSAAIAADVAKLTGDAKAKLREDILIPIAKAWSTDVGVEVASLGVQVHGGMGFIEETGAAQHYRDARIAPIYEGTNGLQAMDLAGRKLSLEGGAGVEALIADIEAAAAECDGDLARLGDQLKAGAASAREAAAWLAARKGSGDALTGATTFLTLFAEVVGGWMHARAALHARSGDRAEEKARLARFYGDQVLSLSPGRLAAVTAGSADLQAWAA